jgi:hypothetical protein
MSGLSAASQIPWRHTFKPLLITKHLLDHKRIDIDQARLEQVQTEQPHLLIVLAVC